MKSLVLFALLSAWHVGAQERIDLSSLKLAKPLFVPNKYIIEVEDFSVLHKRNGFSHPLDAVYHEFKSREIGIDVRREFKMTGIFNGATVFVNNPKDVAHIQNTPGIKAIRPVRVFHLPRTLESYVPTGPMDSKIPSGSLSSLILGGVDKVHAEGNIGNGVKIGIIDSGIAYDHPALGSNGFGDGKKIAIAHDFTVNQTDPNAKNQDHIDCGGHGTHVAGIIAAEPGNPYNITGVAYGATLGSYKIFGCAHNTTEDFVEALLQSEKDGMDVINLSLGQASGWPGSSSAIVANRIAKSGKIVVIAAGNEGSSGSWYTGSPGTADAVISVGSVENTLIAVQNATVNGVDHPPISYISPVPLKVNDSLAVYATSKNISVPDDACASLPADTPDLSKYLVVIRRGGCDLDTKLTNAAAKGAKAIFIYDDGMGSRVVSIEKDFAAFILAADGEFLVQQFSAGAQITVSFPQTGGASSMPDANGGLMSSYSSYGPSFDFKFKPSVSAPGGYILSTVPAVNGSYALMSGTSMAAPYVAGCAALLLAAKRKSPGDTGSIANGARNLFETSSTMIRASHTSSEFDTVTKAGAGLINIYGAIHSETIVSPGELILNDTAHFVRSHTIDVQNTNNSAKTYTVKHVPALTALTMKENSILPSDGPVPLVSAPAAVDISPSTFTVAPGNVQKVDIKVTPPNGVDPSRYPVFSGFVEITSESEQSESYHVSYLGAAANLKDHPIFDNTTDVVSTRMPAFVNNTGGVIEQPTNFTFNDTDHPSVVFRLAMGTPLFRMDLVDSAIQATPAGLTPGITSPHASLDSVKIVGSLYTTYYAVRHDENNSTCNAVASIDAKFENGSTIPNGQYRILLRALRITGDPKVEQDYDSWLGPIFGIFT